MSRPALEVADIFRDHGAAWRSANAGHLSLDQLKVMSAIERFRTAALGGHVARCEDCAHTVIAYNSCRNRHCPKCQGAAAKQWLAEREAELLPVPYFHVVFTLPEPIAAVAYQNKAVIYDLLFKAAAEATLTIAADPKHLGARIGITAVLHTWGSAMTHHPHLRMIVPGGGLSLDGKKWLACRPGFFLPARVLSRLFRRLFLKMLTDAHAAGRLAFFGDHAALANAAAFAAVLMLMIHRHIVRPLQRLENVANAVRETKDYDLRMDYSGDEEIGHLALAFNSMLAELATARKREMSEQLELSRVSRLTTMGAMTASIAHEIKQPLAAIVANGNAGLRWLAHAEPNLDEACGALKQIVDDGNRAGQVIDGIRGLFKPKGDERTYVDIGKLIREVVGLAQSELQKQQISLRTEIAEGLPPILVDRVQLQQVLLNLVMNASDAMDLVSDRTRILRIRSERHDYHGVLTTVEDSGTGIEPQNIERIFEPLFTTKSNGMGMGLSICRSIIESHGGRLWASPGQHHGTVFQFTLPVG